MNKTATQEPAGLNQIPDRVPRLRPTGWLWVESPRPNRYECQDDGNSDLKI